MVNIFEYADEYVNSRKDSITTIFSKYFSVTIEPIVRKVFLGIGIFGLLGFTYQIALLGDLITIVGLHAHCFYIYTKV